MHPRIRVTPHGFQQWKQTSTSVIPKVVTATARLFHKTSMRTPMCVGHGTEFLFFQITPYACKEQSASCQSNSRRSKKKSITVHGNNRFLIMFTTTRHWT